MVTILAFLTMTIDHIGFMFFPGEEIWRIIWRIAFPLFAWGIVRWFRFTKNRENYAKRILILAVISQIPSFFVTWFDLYNVCFTLLFWLFSIGIIESEKVNKLAKIPIILVLLAISYRLNFDYNVYWILTIILLNQFWEQKKSVIYFFILTFLFYCVNFETHKIIFHPQIYSVFAIIILYFTPIRKYDFKINYYVKYLYYPVHLAVLYAIYLSLWK